MWETILEMADDRLWIYTGIVGALLDSFLDFLVDHFGWTWFEQDENAWRKRYPKITKKIDSLESEIQSLKSQIRKG